MGNVSQIGQIWPQKFDLAFFGIWGNGPMIKINANSWLSFLQPHLAVFHVKTLRQAEYGKVQKMLPHKIGKVIFLPIFLYSPVAQWKNVWLMLDMYGSSVLSTDLRFFLVPRTGTEDLLEPEPKVRFQNYPCMKKNRSKKLVKCITMATCGGHYNLLFSSQHKPIVL